MFLWNLMCMTYLREYPGSDLCRPFILKIQGINKLVSIYTSNKFFFSFLIPIPSQISLPEWVHYLT